MAESFISEFDNIISSDHGLVVNTSVVPMHLNVVTAELTTIMGAFPSFPENDTFSACSDKNDITGTECRTDPRTSPCLISGMQACHHPFNHSHLFQVSPLHLNTAHTSLLFSITNQSNTDKNNNTSSKYVTGHSQATKMVRGVPLCCDAHLQAPSGLL